MTQSTTETETSPNREIPENVKQYVNGKIQSNGQGGRPHILALFKKQGRDPFDELFNICELAWIKNKSLGLIAKELKTGSQTIFRVLKDVEPWKDEIFAYIQAVPRRKRWYIEEMDSSDYETIQDYIRRAKRDGLKTYRENIKRAKFMWTALNYRDPAYWNADEVCSVLAGVSSGASQSRTLDCIRQIAPQIANKSTGVKTGRFREKIGRRKKDLFGNEIEMIREALKDPQNLELKTKFDLHVTLGAREGCRDPNSGLAGITWDKLKDGFTRCDLFESKVRGGINWRDCPLDLFFKDLPERLREMWESRGKPTSDKIFLKGYKEVGDTYKQIREILREYYEGHVDPSLLKEFITLRPHDADKIHVNLLWEAEIPLEVVAGQYINKGEGIGIMGRGWLDINVIKKHYLSLTARSERMQKLQQQVRAYSGRFSGIHFEKPVETQIIPEEPAPYSSISHQGGPSHE